ncbi:MAG: kelch repeat-containing protein [Deltaproteobacteria bacterium]|nr:kelch repeat-containing protein [Deltaproteobacteria bacterium]
MKNALWFVSFVASLGCRTPAAVSPRTTAAAPSLHELKWTPVVVSGAPQARHECAFVESGGRFYLLGGRREQPVNIFDPATSTWSEGPAAPMELHHFQAVSPPGDHRIWIIGALTGNYPDEPPVPQIYVYDTKSNVWSTAGEIPAARRRGAAGVSYHDGKFYLAGGLTEGHSGGFVPWLDSYDPATQTWTILPDAPRPRDHFQAGIVGETLVLAGGRTSSARTNEVLTLTIAEVDLYDIQKGTFTTLPAPAGNLPTRRAGTSTVVHDGLLYVLGGESGEQKPAHNHVEALDLKTGAWKILSPLHTGRHGTGALVWRGAIYTAAGSANRGGGPELSSLEALGANPR